MEMSFITTIFFLFLLATPSLSSSKGGSENGGMGSSSSSSSSSSEVYEIDYRGPETHSSHISPPDHSHGRRPWIIHHHQHKLQPNQQPSFNPNSYPLKGSKVGA